MSAALNCPHCGHGVSATIDSRPCLDHVRRRRKCQKCDGRFTTHEIIVPEKGDTYHAPKRVDPRVLIQRISAMFGIDSPETEAGRTTNERNAAR